MHAFNPLKELRQGSYVSLEKLNLTQIQKQSLVDV